MGKSNSMVQEKQCNLYFKNHIVCYRIQRLSMSCVWLIGDYRGLIFLYQDFSQVFAVFLGRFSTFYDGGTDSTCKPPSNQWNSFAKFIQRKFDCSFRYGLLWEFYRRSCWVSARIKDSPHGGADSTPDPTASIPDREARGTGTSGRTGEYLHCNVILAKTGVTFCYTTIFQCTKRVYTGRIPFWLHPWVAQYII